MKQKDEELEREFDCSQVFTEVESVLPKVMVDFEHRIGIQKIWYVLRICYLAMK